MGDGDPARLDQEKASGVDDRGGERAIGRDEQAVDAADRFVLSL